MFRLPSLAGCWIASVTLCTGVVTADPPAKQSDPNWVRPRLVGSASDSGDFAVDEAKVRAMFPNFEWTKDQIGYLNDHLSKGDSRAAMVASVEPLIISCYSDELDAAILVRFPNALVKQYSLGVGDRLIASWIYPNMPKPPSDVVLGGSNLGRYNNGAPIVADFFSSSQEKLTKRKLGVTDLEWERTRELTEPALERARGKYRTAFPLYAWAPPELLK